MNYKNLFFLGGSYGVIFFTQTVNLYVTEYLFLYLGVVTIPRFYPRYYLLGHMY